MGRAGVSWCLVPPNLVFQKSFQREMERCVQTERSLCISQSPHSICMHSSTPVCACRLPVSLWFQTICSYILCPVVGFLRKLQNMPGRLFPNLKNNQSKCSQQPLGAEPLVSDSPVLCWAGCWATVSLLALFPMLRLLSPPASLSLPLPRPTAGKESLNPPRSSLTRHRAPVTQNCLDCLLVSFSLSGLCRLALPLPSACVIWSLPPFLPPSFFHFKTQTHSLILRSLPSWSSDFMNKVRQ